MVTEAMSASVMMFVNVLMINSPKVFLISKFMQRTFRIAACVPKGSLKPKPFNYRHIGVSPDRETETIGVGLLWHNVGNQSPHPFTGTRAEGGARCIRMRREGCTMIALTIERGGICLPSIQARLYGVRQYKMKEGCAMNALTMETRCHISA